MTVRASKRVDRWGVFVVLLCEALAVRGQEPPAEYMAVAALLLANGHVEVVR